MVPACQRLLGRRIGDRQRSDSALDVYADSVVRRVRYCAADPDGAGSTADCANNLFMLQQCARDACDEPRRSALPRRYGTPYQARCLPEKSVHSLPDAVIFVHPRFGHFYAALRISTRKPAAHTIPQAQTSCSGERNTPMKLPWCVQMILSLEIAFAYGHCCSSAFGLNMNGACCRSRFYRHGIPAAFRDIHSKIR